MKKIVLITFLLFVSTGMLGTASAARILDFGVISNANGSIGTDFSIDKAVLKLCNRELAKEELKEQRNNDLDFTTQAAEEVWTCGYEPILAGGVDLNQNNTDGNGITYTPVSDAEGIITTSSSVTEPGTAFLLGSGLLGLVGLKRKKFAKKA